MSYQPNLTTEQLMAYVRASVLSMLYVIALILLWDGVGDWLVTMLEGEPKYARLVPQIQSLETEFATLSGLGFAATALWFARNRSFSPLAKYVVPLLIALWLTLPVIAIALYLVSWLVFLLQAAGKHEVWLMTYIPSVIPGIIGGQLLRFPRPSRSNPAGDASVQAV